MAQAAVAVHGADAGPHAAPDNTVQRARARWFSTHHPVLDERMRGIGDVFGVDPDDERWDLGRLGPIETSPGCSAVFHPGDRTATGHALLGRNFDFPTGTYSEITGGPARTGERPLAADVWVTELRPDNGYATIVVGIMDMLGGIDGLNEAGLAVTLLADNESPAPEPSVVPQAGLSEQQVVRYILETCQDVEEAKQALLLAKQYYLFVPCHFLVADRAGRSFTWEYSPGHNREHIVETTPGESLVCTNHLLHRWPDPAHLPDDRSSAGTAAFTYDRWRALDAQIGRGSAPDVAQVRSQIDGVRFTYPAPGVRTLWQAVYDLEETAIEVAFFAGDRDGTSRYTEPIRFQLASQDQPCATPIAAAAPRHGVREAAHSYQPGPSTPSPNPPGSADTDYAAAVG
ncbi:C45 family autoproteolytic acyltransferase/hydrolase [Nocardioides astragali]|uniref:C45 family autoproteolytic acyltransferase/hydrolase n=2 Tax=Nocardioides astragali TaxID=1776736 RepID=A0ABW2N8D0_9ACTN